MNRTSIAWMRIMLRWRLAPQRGQKGGATDAAAIAIGAGEDEDAALEAAVAGAIPAAATTAGDAEADGRSSRWSLGARKKRKAARDRGLFLSRTRRGTRVGADYTSIAVAQRPFWRGRNTKLSPLVFPNSKTTSRLVTMKSGWISHPVPTQSNLGLFLSLTLRQRELLESISMERAFAKRSRHTPLSASVRVNWGSSLETARTGRPVRNTMVSRAAHCHALLVCSG